MIVNAVPIRTSAVIKTIITANPLFNNKPQGHTLTTYIFPPSGQVSYRNNRTTTGNMTIAIPFFAWNGFPQTTAQAAQQFFANATNPNFFKFNYNINIAGHTAIISIMYKQKGTTADFKVTINGTYSSAGTLRFQFNNNLALSVSCDTKINRIQYGSAGFEWVDAPTAIADCINNRLTFPVTTSFRIDPTTIGTSTSAAAFYGDWQNDVWQANGRFWVFYTDGTNALWRTSTDGGTTWSSANTYISGVTVSYNFAQWIDSSNNICYNRSNGGGAKSFRTRCGTANSDGTITWNFAERIITTTNAGDVPVGSTSEDTNNNLYFGFLVKLGTIYYVQVERCAGGSSNWGTCTWTNILNSSSATTNRQQIVLRPVLSGNLILIYGRDGSTSSAKFISCASPCSSSANWGSVITSSQTDFSFGQSSFINVGNTIYGALYEAATVQFTSFAYGASSCCTLTNLGSVTGLKGVEIGTDSNNQLIIVYTDATTMKDFLSSNLGTSWSSSETQVTGETSIQSCCGNAGLEISQYGLNGYYGVSWVAGSPSPYNIRFVLIANVPQIIQSKSCTFTASTGTCAFTSNTLANDIVLVIAGNIVSTTVSTVTDTQLLTYTKIVSEDVGTIGDIEGWCSTATSANADTITVAYGVSVTATIILYELGTQKCNTSSSVGTGTAVTSASVSSYIPSNPTLVIGAIDSTCQVACTVSAGTSYVLDKTVNTGAANTVDTEYIQNFGTAETTPFTFSTSSSYNEISIAFIRTFNPTLSDTTTASESILRTPQPILADSTILTETILKTAIPKLADSLTISESIPITTIHLLTDSISIAETAFRGAIENLNEAFNIVITIPLFPVSPIPLPSIPQDENSIIWILLLVLLGTIFLGAIIRNIALRNRFNTPS